MSIPYEIDKIDANALAELIEYQVSESETLDYKKGAPDTWRKSSAPKPEAIQKLKAEFLKDVTAFANAKGGDLVYGVAEGTGAAAGGILGFDYEKKDQDGLERHLQDLCRENISPPIQLQFRFVTLDDAKTVLVVRVPDSWNKPHMVTLKYSTDFFVRRNTESIRMDIHTIRSTVLGSAELRAQIRQFRRTRVDQVRSGEAAILPPYGPFLLFHLVPLQLYRSGKYIDISKCAETFRIQTLTNANYADETYNVDGLIRYIADHDGPLRRSSYVQVFRNGCIEAFEERFFASEKVQLFGIAQQLVKAAASYFNFYIREDIRPPYVAMLTLSGLSGRKIDQPWELNFYSENIIDRDQLLLPDVLIESVNGHTVELLDPLLHQLWQACGYKEIWPGALDKMRKEYGKVHSSAWAEKAQ